MSSPPSGSHLDTSSPLPSPSTRVNDKDGRGVAHGSANALKKLEHAPPSEAMPSTGLGVADSLERPTNVSARNHDVAPGAFLVVPSSHSTPTSQAFRSSVNLYDSNRVLTNEESKQEDGVPNSAGLVAAKSGLYAVEAQLVPDGNEEGTTIVVEAHSVTVKWYQRPLFRWMSACGLVGVVVIIVVLVVIVIRPRSASSSSSLMSPTPEPTTAPPTPEPTSVPPEQIACNFLTIPDLTTCQSKEKFVTSVDVTTSDKTTGYTIPSEIGVLTQLTHLDFSKQKLTSTIPSEIGLLTRLTFLSFFSNSMTSTIPTEIGLLQNLTWLAFDNNSFNSTIPSELGLLTELEYLFFFKNTLTSTIPSEIGLLTKLTMLAFSDNSLTSTIPSEIGLLAQLIYVSFYSNSLTSTIPSEIGLLTRLTNLYFFNNQLQGTIPSSLCSLPALNNTIVIDCAEITCPSGCCSYWDYSVGSAFFCP